VVAATDSAPSSTDLPREVVYVLLAAPVVIQPIVNPDFFHEPALPLLLEIAANYIPALAIVLGLHTLYRTSLPKSIARVSPEAAKLGLHTAACATVAMVMSLLVHSLHRYAIGEHIPLVAYLQRNVGFTCLLVLPSLFLQAQRARAHRAEKRALELGHAALLAELESLRSRTQPHFLFNVLNTLGSLMREDVELAERTLHRLAEILRYALASTRTEWVLLRNELAVVEAYLELERARFGERLRYELEIAEDARRARVAPFLLQPLVENAVLHGIAGRAKGGALHITARVADTRLVLRVEDDGPGRGASTHHGSGTSLEDLGRRLELLYAGDATLVTRDAERGGFVVEITLPYTNGAA
jgi:anti-sigma regulatory factor (Ser/Thr protein kinase)